MLKEMWPDICPVSTVGEFGYDPGKGPVKHITMPPALHAEHGSH